MKFLVVIAVLFMSSKLVMTAKAFAGIGVNIGGSYVLETVPALIAASNFNDATDVKMTGLKFNLQLPIAFVDTDSSSVYFAPSVGYRSLKSPTYGVPFEGDSVIPMDFSSTAVPVGATLGADFKSGSLSFGAGLFYEMDMSGKFAVKISAQEATSLVSKGSTMGLKLGAKNSLSQNASLGGFLNYAFSRTLEIVPSADTGEKSVKYKAKQLGFGAEVSIAFGSHRAAASPKKVKKSKRSKDESSEVNSSPQPEGEESVPAGKKIKKKKSSKKE